MISPPGMKWKIIQVTETWILSSLAGNKKFERLQKIVPSSDVLPDADIPEPIIPDCERMIEDQSADEDSDEN